MGFLPALKKEEEFLLSFYQTVLKIRFSDLQFFYDIRFNIGVIQKPCGHMPLNQPCLLCPKYSVNPQKAVSSLRLVPYPWAILKIRPPSSLDYRARHGPQTTPSGIQRQNFDIFKLNQLRKSGPF